MKGNSIRQILPFKEPARTGEAMERIVSVRKKLGAYGFSNEKTSMQFNMQIFNSQISPNSPPFIHRQLVSKPGGIRAIKFTTSACRFFYVYFFSPYHIKVPLNAGSCSRHLWKVTCLITKKKNRMDSLSQSALR